MPAVVVIGRTLGLVLLLAACVYAQDAKPAPDPSEAAYQQALHCFKQRKWVAGRNAMRAFAARYPQSKHAADARARSGENCYLGTEILWKSGPPARRIDVAVMGDGFTIGERSQRKHSKWAREVTEVLWSESALSSYRNYFNFYFVRLASHEKGVDPSEPADPRRRPRKKKRKRGYSTALDAKALGTQGQVLMSRELVYRWLDIAERDMPGVGDDRYVIAFAQFGKLGMAGGGIANVGRPDKSITTHEFGHAFSRLLDEYAFNPGPPQKMIGRTLRAPNVYVSRSKPNPRAVPWAHFLMRQAKKVGLYEGGATYETGVWRPARGCAMNSAGNREYCPVCREQTILVIYEYVSPIDEAIPAPAREVVISEGEDESLTIVPMQPRKHFLDVKWYIAKHNGKPDRAQRSKPPAEGEAKPTDGLFLLGGPRAREDRSMYKRKPAGERYRYRTFQKARVKGKTRIPARSVLSLAKLRPGKWRITCQVADTTRWVIKDSKHLLKERVSWTVTVKPKS